jgi:2-polyprenyl-6-methoxyphenol hydroxylase-like FAD-dependent oxidoreductase
MKTANAGAGIGGLAVAAFLADAGHDIQRFNQFAAPPIGSGLMIQPMGLAVLDLCGAANAVRASGQRITRMLGQDGHRCILDVTYGPPQTAHRFQGNSPQGHRHPPPCPPRSPSKRGSKRAA